MYLITWFVRGSHEMLSCENLSVCVFRVPRKSRIHVCTEDVHYDLIKKHLIHYKVLIQAPISLFPG